MKRKPKTIMACVLTAVVLLFLVAWWGISAATSGVKGHDVIQQDNSGPNLVGAQRQSEDQQ